MTRIQTITFKKAAFFWTGTTIQPGAYIACTECDGNDDDGDCPKCNGECVTTCGECNESPAIGKAVNGELCCAECLADLNAQFEGVEA